jgi:hypothetical protein
VVDAVESIELQMLSTVKHNGDTRLSIANSTIKKIKRSRRRQLQRRLSKILAMGSLANRLFQL